MVNITIYVVDEPYNTRLYGTAKSTSTEIKVNKVGDLYTIVFPKAEFKELDPKGTMVGIVNIFRDNLTDSDYNFDVEFTGADGSDIASQINAFNQLIYNYNEHKKIDGGKNSSTANQLRAAIDRAQREEPNPHKSFYEDFEEYDGVDDDDDPYDEFDPNDYFDSFAYSPKLESGKDKYDRSVVWKKSKNIKRSINRHGVVISSKDNMRRDKKLIKKFLKDFIPGDAGWKKEFRDELAKRWLSVYAVSKKSLKNLEKDYRKKRDKKNSARTRDIVKFANRLFSNEDTWNNPNK